MKSLFSSLLCASLLVFTVGCGKENKSGSGGVAPATFNPIVSPNMPQSGQQALANLKTWYESPETAQVFRGTFIKKTESQSSGFQLDYSFSFCLFGYGSGCNQTAPAPTHCFIKNGSGSYDLGTATGTMLTQCSIIQANMTKANNQELTAAVNGNGYHLLDVQQLNGFFHLVYGVNAFQPAVVYTIDTNLPSVLNPVKVQNFSNSSISNVTSIMFYQY